MLAYRMTRNQDAPCAALSPRVRQVVKWLAESNGEAALWRVRYDDGDEEDMEWHEVQVALVKQASRGTKRCRQRATEFAEQALLAQLSEECEYEIEEAKRRLAQRVHELERTWGVVTAEAACE